MGLEILRTKLKEIKRKDPRGYTWAISLTVVNEILDEYDEFVKGIEEEFSSKDKLNIFQGIAERKLEAWEEISDEEREERIGKVIEAYEDYKISKRRKVERKNGKRRGSG